MFPLGTRAYQVRRSAGDPATKFANSPCTVKAVQVAPPSSDRSGAIPERRATSAGFTAPIAMSEWAALSNGVEVTRVRGAPTDEAERTRTQSAASNRIMWEAIIGVDGRSFNKLGNPGQDRSR